MYLTEQYTVRRKTRREYSGVALPRGRGGIRLSGSKIEVRGVYPTVPFILGRSKFPQSPSHYLDNLPPGALCHHLVLSRS